MTNLYAGKAVDVNRVLLVSYPEGFSLRRLAKESSVSLGEAFKVSKTLINERIAMRESRNGELKLMAPHELLERLAKVHSFLYSVRFIEYYTPEEEINRFFHRLKKVKATKYAVTGLAGAMLVAPFVRPSNIHVYVKSEDDAAALAKALDMVPVESNGNVKLAIVKSNGVFYGAHEMNGVTVVSDVQLYIDLLNYPARGEEAASEVYKKIRKDWEEMEKGMN